MPVEIRELIIKAVVRENKNQPGHKTAGELEKDKARFMAVVNEKVLEILKEKKER